MKAYLGVLLRVVSVLSGTRTTILVATTAKWTQIRWLTNLYSNIGSSLTLATARGSCILVLRNVDISGYCF